MNTFQKSVDYVCLTFTYYTHSNARFQRKLFQPSGVQGGGEGGGWMSSPIRFFLKFFKKYYLDLPFSIPVRISLRHFLTQVWWELVAMVARYSKQVVKPFLKKNVFFTLFRWKMQKTLTKSTNNVLFFMSSIINFQFLMSFDNFLFCVKIQDGAQNRGHLGWRHRPSAARQPIICTWSCRAHHRLSTKGEVFSKYFI